MAVIRRCDICNRVIESYQKDEDIKSYVLYQHGDETDMCNDCYREFIEVVKARRPKEKPPVIKNRPNGEWLNYPSYSGWTCSECNYHDGNKIDNYCPNCGAYMKRDINEAKMGIDFEDMDDEEYGDSNHEDGKDDTQFISD